jgi:hypothetical protein
LNYLCQRSKKAPATSLQLLIPLESLKNHHQFYATIFLTDIQPLHLIPPKLAMLLNLTKRLNKSLLKVNTWNETNDNAGIN